MRSLWRTSWEFIPTKMCREKCIYTIIVHMCRAVACPNCSKTTWAGCGLHIASALKGIALADRCDGWQTGKCLPIATPPTPTPKPTLRPNLNLSFMTPSIISSLQTFFTPISLLFEYSGAERLLFNGLWGTLTPNPLKHYIVRSSW